MIHRKAFIGISLCLMAVLCLSSLSAQRIGRGNRTGGIYSGTRLRGNVYGGTGWYRAPYYGNYYGGYGGYYAPGYWGYGGVSATPQQGMADIIRAQGQAAESRAKAAISTQEAQSKYLDNKEKYLEIQKEIRKNKEISKQKKLEEQQKRKEQRIAEREAKHAEEGNPQRQNTLTDSQLDPNTGKIYWPQELQNVAYENQRIVIDEAFILKNSYSHSSEQTLQAVDDAVDKMSEILVSRIHEINSMDYITARRFLERVKNEAKVMKI